MHSLLPIKSVRSISIVPFFIIGKNIRKRMRNKEELAWLVACAVCSGKNRYAVIADFALTPSDASAVGCPPPPITAPFPSALRARVIG